MSEATGSDPCHLTCWSPLTHSTQASLASFLSLNLPSTCPPRGPLRWPLPLLGTHFPKRAAWLTPSPPRSSLKRHLGDLAS